MHDYTDRWTGIELAEGCYEKESHSWQAKGNQPSHPQNTKCLSLLVDPTRDNFHEVIENTGDEPKKSNGPGKKEI